MRFILNSSQKILGLVILMVFAASLMTPLDCQAKETTEGERKILFHRHPMNPTVTSPVPNKDEMGMDYTPVYVDEVSMGESKVPGHAVISISPERQQLIGVRTAVVELRVCGESALWSFVVVPFVFPLRVRCYRLSFVHLSPLVITALSVFPTGDHCFVCHRRW